MRSLLLAAEIHNPRMLCKPKPESMKILLPFSALWLVLTFLWGEQIEILYWKSNSNIFSKSTVNLFVSIICWITSPSFLLDLLINFDLYLSNAFTIYHDYILLCYLLNLRAKIILLNIPPQKSHCHPVKVKRWYKRNEGYMDWNWKQRSEKHIKWRSLCH